MSEEVLKRLEDHLSCSICLDTYTNPKLLKCFHVFCQQCLVHIPLGDQQGQRSLTCPTCRQETPIPVRGVAGLQSAFHINHLLEIKDAVKSLQTLPEGAIGYPQSKVKHCLEHTEEQMKLYCKSCEEAICLKCAIKGSEHFSHDYEELSLVFERYKGEILPLLESMRERVTKNKNMQEKLDMCNREISSQRGAVENDIRATFRQLHEVLHVRENELISQLQQITQGKLKDLAVQSKQVEITLAQLASCLHFVRVSLETGNKEDLMLIKSDIIKQAKDLSTATPFSPGVVEADVVLSASTDISTACQNFGKLVTLGSPDPSKCQTTLKEMCVGERHTALLRAVNFRGDLCEEPIKSLECELISEITGTRSGCSVERMGQSWYEISYQPTVMGRHQLHVKVEGQHIGGSPSSISVKSRVEKLGIPVLTLEGVKGPWGVAITQKGEVVVSEREGDCVSVFSPSGKKIRSFGMPGSGKGQFRHPRGVAVDGEGNVLVVDCGNNRIQKFTTEGQLLASTKGSGSHQFSYPTDIAFNASTGMIYIVDQDNYRIQVLNSDLTFSHTFKKEGSGRGQFFYPRGIACDSTGVVYVSDSSNHRIRAFTAEGKFLRMFGSRGEGKGELDMPSCVAIDLSDLVHVSEAINNRVSVFTSEGHFVTSFSSGRKGSGPREFNGPCGLAINLNGVVYVCDCNNDRVQVF